MSDTRQRAHELIDRLPETEISTAVGFLESIVDPDKATLQSAPFDNEGVATVSLTRLAADSNRASRMDSEGFEQASQVALRERSVAFAGRRPWALFPAHQRTDDVLRK